MGHWLGLMTLARNVPILMLDLDMKPLVIEAYHKGQQELLYVVPFVAKVLESCAKSKVRSDIHTHFFCRITYPNIFSFSRSSSHLVHGQ